MNSIIEWFLDLFTMKIEVNNAKHAEIKEAQKKEKKLYIPEFKEKHKEIKWYRHIFNRSDVVRYESEWDRGSSVKVRTLRNLQNLYTDRITFDSLDYAHDMRDACHSTEMPKAELRDNYRIITDQEEIDKLEDARQRAFNDYGIKYARRYAEISGQGRGGNPELYERIVNQNGLEEFRNIGTIGPLYIRGDGRFFNSSDREVSIIGMRWRTGEDTYARTWGELQDPPAPQQENIQPEDVQFPDGVPDSAPEISVEEADHQTSSRFDDIN
jgi:hypothetical protein